MNRMKTFAFALALALGVGGAGLAHAQATHGEHGMGGMMMKHCPMMASMGQSPRAILEHAGELALTSDQIARLETLRDDAAASRSAAMAEMRELHAEIDPVVTAETFDEAEASDLFDRMGELHADMALSMARAGHAARDVLTVDQREGLAELVRGSGGMMGSDTGMGRMGGMMEMMRHCPMMGSGGMGPGETGAPGGEG